MEDIYESGEMYLETILLLQKSKGTVRSVDIVNDLGYAKSSVSKTALKSAARPRFFVLLPYFSRQFFAATVGSGFTRRKKNLKKFCKTVDKARAVLYTLHCGSDM